MKATAGGKLKRKDLLEIYVEAKKSLEEQKRHLAFLSIDVVDSTGMKVGEEPGIAERDFNRFKKLVVEIINKHRALKSTWTPDGVMVCFNDVTDAVLSAQAIIKGIEKFNKDVKVIKRDFAIRAGINSGDVFYDEATPLEEMTDRVIDIAGHMQKHGCVNGITIGRHSIEQLISEFDFHDAGREVDGYHIFEWN
jgi:class 3 adenylate cyclase